MPPAAIPAGHRPQPPLISAELFLYPGDQHLFADGTLPSYDAEAAALLTERVLAFLAAE
jgi:dienelactone hydrolase